MTLISESRAKKVADKLTQLCYRMENLDAAVQKKGSLELCSYHFKLVQDALNQLVVELVRDAAVEIVDFREERNRGEFDS